MPLYQNIHSFCDQETYITLTTGETYVTYTSQLLLVFFCKIVLSFSFFISKKELGSSLMEFLSMPIQKPSKYLCFSKLSNASLRLQPTEYQGYMCVNKAAGSTWAKRSSTPPPWIFLLNIWLAQSMLKTLVLLKQLFRKSIPRSKTKKLRGWKEE